MGHFFRQFFRKSDEPPKMDKRNRDFSFPKFLDTNPDVLQTRFQVAGQSDSGSATIVFPFKKVPKQEMTDTPYKSEEYVVKRYDPVSEAMDKTLFGEGYKTLTLHEKCIILKARHKRVENFFSEIPNLVLPSRYVLSGEDSKDAKIYEIQEKILGGIQDLDPDSLILYIRYLSTDQRKNLELTLDKIIQRIEKGIEKMEKVPDINFSNFLFTYEGEIRYIDTNVEFDWKELGQNIEFYSDAKAHQIRAIQKLKYLFKKLTEF